MSKHMIRDEAGTTKRFEAEGHPALTYDDYGDPSEPPVILLHGGAAGSRHSWLDIPHRLAEAFRVLALDMRGHGDSDRANGAYRIEHYAADVEAFIEQVTGAPAALIGHSWGGLVAAHVAGTRPELVSKAVFEDAPLRWKDVPQARSDRPFRAEAFRQQVDGLLDDGVSHADLTTAAVREWMETGNFFGPRQQILLAYRDGGTTVEEIIALMLDEPLPGTDTTLADLLGADQVRTFVTGLIACDPDIFTARKALAAYDRERPMTCPVLMLRADPARGPAPIGAAFLPDGEAPFLATHPRAMVEFVEGASHAMHFERPEWFTERLLAFLGAE